MKSIFSLLIPFFLLMGCNSAPSTPTTNKSPDTLKFSSIEIDLTLTQRQIVDSYPNQDQLEVIIQQISREKFSENNLIASDSPYSAKISIDYQRRFAGEDSPIVSKSVMAPLVGYTIVIFDGEKEKQRIEDSNLTTNKGFLSNLKTTFTLGLGKTAKDEEQDYEMLANTLLEELISVRK